jgi:hypothetical protein
VKPLTRRRSAATRPHVLLLIGLAFALVWASPAEAGRRAHKSKKVRARAQAQTESHTRRPSPSTTPSAAPSSTVAEAGKNESARASAARPREKVFDFSGLELGGSERMPQLLYFLDRAEEELERASLERRSFVPEMMRSLDEEHL